MRSRSCIGPRDARAPSDVLQSMRKLLLVGFVSTALVAGAAHAAGDWAGRPSSPPPKLGSVTDGPPPAWIESRTRSWWLAYTSFCWKTSCVDFIPPERREDLALIRVRRGASLRLHLGFTPAKLSVSIGTGSGTGIRQLQRKRTVTFTPWRSGFVFVSARASTGGDAAYVARIRLG